MCRKEITKDKRTLQQNKYIHVVFGILGDELGYSMAEIKQLCKQEFGLYDEAVNKKTGETFYVYRSTADLSKKDFAEFTEKILILAGKMGIHILNPEEYFNTPAIGAVS